ncbi:MAG: DUF1802 family protein [Verrucomicrobiota bacterium]
MQIAFKEWFIIVDALGRGEQILILRKGGISEGRGGFNVDHPRFWLFPTLFHQQRESVILPAQRRFDEIAPDFPDPTTVRLNCFAEVAAWRRLDSLADAEKLRGQHIWRDEVIAGRFEWGRSKAIFALAVRVFKVEPGIVLPMRPGYGGCKSWIEIEENVPVTESKAVLDENAFREKLQQFNQAAGVLAAKME